MKRIVAISDLQCPYEDRRAVESVARFIEEYKPDTVISVGDEADLAPISRYSEHTEEWFSRDLGKQRDRTVEVLRMLQVKHITRSNHLDRWFSALARVPAFRGVPEFQLEEFLRFKELGITYHPTPWSPAPGWLLMHGDEGSLSRSAGSTAAGLAARTSQSVICGHTHRLGLVPVTHTWLGNKTPRTLFGFEAGCLADFNSPGMAYMKFKNWQQGFGLLLVEGKHVTPVPIPIIGRSFVVDGVRYKW